MMKYIYLFCFLFCLSTVHGQMTSEKIEINEDMLIHNLKVISHDSLEGRFFGTVGNYKAQKYIAEQFDSLGVEPLIASGYIQEFPYTFKKEFRQEVYPVLNPGKDYINVPDTTVAGGNVLAVIKGKTNKNIIITAHFDHLGIMGGEIFNGADDNAAGASALISIASYFKDRSPKHNLVFAAVDAEEINSLGCQYFLDNSPFPLEDITLNINMDMIAHNDSRELYASGFYHNPTLKKALDDIETYGLELLFGHDKPGKMREDDWTYSSDHREFFKNNIPYVYFGVEDHEDYHQSTDTFENINPEFYISAVKLIINAIESYDSYLYEEVGN